MGELVLIPRDLAERVTEIANRNEQSAEGDRLAALLSSPTPSLPEDVARYSASRSLQGIVQDPNGRLVAYSDFQSLSSQLAGALAERDYWQRRHDDRTRFLGDAEAERDRLAAELVIANAQLSDMEFLSIEGFMSWKEDRKHFASLEDRA